MRTVASRWPTPASGSVTLRLGGHVDRRRRRPCSRRSGRTIEFLGYLRAYVEGVDDPTPSSKTARRSSRRSPKATRVDCRELRPSGHTTQPPARYTEASLVKELEERGIGRPSTYARVIETILTRATTCGRRAPRSSRRGPRSRRCSCSSATSRTSSTTGSPPRWRRRSTSIARGEGEAEKWLHSFYFGNGTAGSARAGLRGAPRADRHGRGQHDRDRARRRRQRAHRARVAERREHRARRREGAASRRPRARRADLEQGRGAARQAVAAGRATSAPTPRPASPVLVLTGRFGPFVQLGEQDDGSKEKPKRASLFASHGPGHGHARAKRSRCCRCRASSASTPTAARSPRRTGATART